MPWTRWQCKEIPLKPCEASRKGVHFKTASGERVAHEGMRTIECIMESNLIRRLTGAVTGVKKVLLAVSRLTETGHYVHAATSRTRRTAVESPCT